MLDKWVPDLKDALQKVPTAGPREDAPDGRKKVPDMMVEVLELVREQSRQVRHLNLGIERIRLDSKRTLRPPEPALNRRPYLPDITQQLASKLLEVGIPVRHVGHTADRLTINNRIFSISGALKIMNGEISVDELRRMFKDDLIPNETELPRIVDPKPNPVG